MAAAEAAALAEAKLAGQASSGRTYMERIAELKSQLHTLQQIVRQQVSSRQQRFKCSECQVTYIESTLFYIVMQNPK